MKPLTGIPRPGDPTATVDAVHVRAHPEPRVRLQHDFHLTLPAFRGGEWIIHVAQAPSGGGQFDTTTVSRVRQVHGWGNLEPTREGSVLGRSMRSLSFDASALEVPNRLHVRTVYETIPLRRELVGGRSSRSITQLSGEERAWYLAETAALDFKRPEMAQWIRNAGLERSHGESETAFACRALVTMKRYFRWVDVRAFDPGHRASLVCRARRGDCAKLSLVYVAVLRANRVPARILGVRWLPTGGGHIMTEFHGPETGWVPVDVLVAAEGAGDDDGPDPAVGFGSTPGSYFVHYSDDGFELPTFHGLHTILGLHSVAWYVRGEGDCHEHQVDESWNVSSA